MQAVQGPSLSRDPTLLPRRSNAKERRLATDSKAKRAQTATRSNMATKKKTKAKKAPKQVKLASVTLRPVVKKKIKVALAKSPKLKKRTFNIVLNVTMPPHPRLTPLDSARLGRKIRAGIVERFWMDAFVDNEQRLTTTIGEAVEFVFAGRDASI